MTEKKKIEHLVEKVQDLKKKERTAKATTESVWEAYTSVVRALDGATIWEADVETLRFNFVVSSDMEEAFGYPIKRALAEADFWERHLHPEDRAPAQSILADLKKKGEGAYARFDHRIVTPGGSVPWFNSHVHVGRAGGKLVFLGFSLDITDRKRKEADAAFLAEASQILAEPLDYVTTLKHLTRLAVPRIADWCLVDMIENGQSRRIAFAHKSEAIEKSTLRHLNDYPPRFFGRPIGGPVGVMETGRTEYVAEVTDERLNGLDIEPERLALIKELGVRSYIAVPLIARGRVLGAISLNRIEPANAFSLADRGLAEELAKRAALAVDNALLLTKAQRETRLREDLMMVMSHDLKNPLSSILMSAALTRKFADEEQPQTYRLSLIKRQCRGVIYAGERMLRIVENHLDVAKIESGSLVLQRQNMDVRELVKQAVDLIAPLASAKSIQITVESPDMPLTISCDRERVLQIFSNLLGNAIKFSPEGGSVVLGVRPDRENVLFSVADRGIGISESAMPRVFDRFWQATASGRAGTGLGLAIAKGIVQAHGGAIWVASQVGRGSTFYFTLPIAAASSSAGRAA